MASRKRATKIGDLSVIVVVGGAAYYIYRPTLPTLSWGLVWVATAMIWISFFMPTHCDYQTQRNKPCDRWVRGKLRGCRDHGRWKRDALFTAVRLRNPGLLFRTMWSAPAFPPTPPTPSPGPHAPTKQSATDAAMLFFTMVSALAAVLALFK